MIQGHGNTKRRVWNKFETLEIKNAKRSTTTTKTLALVTVALATPSYDSLGL